MVMCHSPITLESYIVFIHRIPSRKSLSLRIFKVLFHPSRASVVIVEKSDILIPKYFVYNLDFLSLRTRLLYL